MDRKAESSESERQRYRRQIVRWITGKRDKIDRWTERQIGIQINRQTAIQVNRRTDILYSVISDLYY